MSDVQRYLSVTRLDDALDLLAEHGAGAQIVAGATDLMRETPPPPKQPAKLWIDITRVPQLDAIAQRGAVLHLGPLVTHSRVVRSPLVVAHALPLAQACLEVGTPQVRNRGTLAGGIAAAQPSSDPLPALIALGATALLRSATGERSVRVRELATPGAIRPDEMIVDLAVPMLGASQRGLFAKCRPRRGAALATVNLAVVLDFATDETVTRAALAAGGGARPAAEVDVPLVGRRLDATAIAEIAQRVAQAAHTGDDVRASGGYRRAMLEVLSRRALRTLGKAEERSCWPSAPVALWSTPSAGDVPSGDGFAASHEDASPIVATVNGRRCEAPGSPGTSLLAWLRDGLGLTGCKDGCGEGVCGACTVLLDGLAVAACLVPAPRAHGAEIVTVEGLAASDGPSALQRSFVDAGAIQCGFCTPGFLVAGTALLAERPRPSREDIEGALAGNLCRCTGYRAIAQAIQSAADIRGDRAL